MARELNKTWATATVGVVIATGPDVVPFLQRMGTQDISKLKPGETTFCCFLDKRGRILFSVHHVCVDEDTTMLLARGQSGAALGAYFEKFIFAEKIELRTTDAMSLVMSFQAEAHLVIEDWKINAVPTFQVQAEDGALRNAYFSTGPLSADAEDPTFFAAAEVAGGVPLAGHELTSEVDPLSAGVAAAIDWDKGCYVGQEVVSRMDSRDKIPYTLVGVQEVPDTASHGEILVSDGKPVGKVTRRSPSQEEIFPGCFGALALVKSKFVTEPVMILGQEVRLTAVVPTFSR